ncbi:MAG: hypothetical protein L0220_09665 [Acidobacteria bacterium]|nr:hypothetical protein [Acidobacteriota bacterium]
MFCPQCSNEILSERVRFCTRCSFPVGTVKELVATEAAKSKVEEGKNDYPLRQQDISLGAGLMVIGLMKAIVVVTSFGGGNSDHELLVLTLTLGLFFSAALMFSQLSPRRRGLTVGATIIFLGSLFGVAAGLLGGGPTSFFTIVVIFLLFSIFCEWLLGGLGRLFFDKQPPRESPDHPPRTPLLITPDTAQPLLPQMQNTAVELNPQETKTQEPVQHFSITEDSTSLLNKN